MNKFIMIDKGDDRGKTLRVISEDRDHFVCIDQENPTQTLLYEKSKCFYIPESDFNSLLSAKQKSIKDWQHAVEELIADFEKGIKIILPNNDYNIELGRVTKARGPGACFNYEWFRDGDSSFAFDTSVPLNVCSETGVEVYLKGWFAVDNDIHVFHFVATDEDVGSKNYFLLTYEEEYHARTTEWVVKESNTKNPRLTFNKAITAYYENQKNKGLRIAIYYGNRFERYTTFEELLEESYDKDKAQMIISDLKRTGVCARPIKGSIEAVYYKIVP
ncbi:hypothetical protein [Paenibacillus sp. FSL K6-2859]|uniref:hypothetical protein n=1 Tax=Paenibacillus sp. FSL K6-2859 TaxID=2921482 RepID=UPI0030F92D9F